MVEAQRTRWALRLLAVGYVLILVVLPLSVMVLRTFEDGVAAFVESITSPEAVTAITLSVEVAIQAVLINTVFGITVSLLITRYRFRGRNVLNALIDVPVSVSPVIAGLALILVYGSNGWFGGFLQNIGVQVIYSGARHRTRHLLRVVAVGGPGADPGARRDRPRTGAGRTVPGRQRLATLGAADPAERPLGTRVRSRARLAWALGEFGAVRVVAGNVLGSTQTMPLLAAQRYNDLDENGAFAISFVMVAIAICCIIVVALLRPSDEER